MLKECQPVSIFCEIDDFCRELDKNMPDSRSSDRLIGGVIRPFKALSEPRPLGSG